MENCTVTEDIESLSRSQEHKPVQDNNVRPVGPTY